MGLVWLIGSQHYTLNSATICPINPDRLSCTLKFGELPGKVDDALFVACHERSVWQEFPCHCVYYTAHLLQRVQVADIAPTGKLVNVAVKVLYAHLVIGAVVASLQECPKGLDTVRMSLSVYVFCHGMLNSRMLERVP